MPGYQIYDQQYRSPGVYVEESFSLPPQMPFTTGVPLFLGLTAKLPRQAASEPAQTARLITLWSQFDTAFGGLVPGGYLADAVHGFFKNGGAMCYVRPVREITPEALQWALETTEYLSQVDLVCVPDIGMQPETNLELRQIVASHCDKMGTRFAILDSRPDEDASGALQDWNEIDGFNGALYYPWIRVRSENGEIRDVPPSGHIAGIYSRCDQRVGLHKAPANENINGALDLSRPVTDRDQAQLNPHRVNCLRFFPGRGILVWGARTISGLEEWKYINVRRLFLTAARWMRLNMFDAVFENNNTDLWARIERELTTYLLSLYERGSLKGRRPEEAFYVKCDAETNPPDLREKGQVVTEVGLAPTAPYEYIVVRLLHGARGATIGGPEAAE